MDFSNFPVISTILSLIVCWALFAIVCSMVHEVISQIKAERGRFLQKYLLLQLNDVSNGVNWAALLYMHGSVDMLSRDVNRPSGEITPKLFAETLVEIVGSSHIVQVNAAAGSTVLTNPVLKNFHLATQVLQPSDVVAFLKQAYNGAELAATQPDKTVNEAMLYTALVSNVETWYNNLQGRMTVWYKKRSRMRLFWLGVIIAAVINVDSVQLFTILNKNENAKTAVLGYYSKNQAALEDVAHRLAITDTVNVKNGSNAALVTSVDSLTHFTKEMDSLARAAQLPIGFDGICKGYQKAEKPKTTFIILKLIGILISGFAASVGAPFWFDLLKKTYTKK